MAMPEEERSQGETQAVSRRQPEERQPVGQVAGAFAPILVPGIADRCGGHAARKISLFHGKLEPDDLRSL